MSSNKISSEFEIRNPDELYEFIKDKEGFVELINKSLDLFKAYYPNSTYTLEYIDYLEGYEFNIIFCFISDIDSFDIDLYGKLSDDFTDLSFQFGNIKKYYSFCIDKPI